MKRYSSIKSCLIAVGLLILIELSPLVTCYPECSKYISEWCKCESTDYSNSYSCSKDNETISVYSTSSLFEVKCENISDGQIYNLLNINRDNQELFISTIYMNSCPRSVVTLIEKTIIQHNKNSELRIIANEMASLPENILHSQSHLKKLEFEGNQLKTLPKNIFESQTQLKILFFKGYAPSNNIFKSLSKLKIFYLRGKKL